ncbi:Gfo/Idh/MocA family protein [Ruminiclostridium papyrosolvens]|uniref:Dehydrogenase n=1 Tax=Ruminiclostridium papyrosolvens C7 TaxID=1330534 RepID=U4R1I1_9FIRM|nr:Gfo/Idh/MocA family oxidoreductase [Ruminiclostridium papyrosolvens]EPR10817.1 dehydrogenase [Ruminiclostridium papyrosolvens C7]
MKDSIKIGIAGCGWIAQNAHIPAFQTIRGVEIISVFDNDIQKTNNVTKKFNIKKAYDNYEDFLESEIDAVVISTPNYTHGDFSIKALQKGKHVLCEKPITIHSKDAADIIRVAHENKRVFMPGFVNRFREDIKKMDEIISKGEIGEIKKIKAGWIRKSGVPRPGTWFTNKELSGGGVLIDLGPHILDLCLMLLKENRVKDIMFKASRNYNSDKDKGASWFDTGEFQNSVIDVEDTIISNIIFENDTVIELNLCWMAPVKGDHTYFDVQGSKGTLKLKTLFGFSNDRLWDKDSIAVSKLDGFRNEVVFDRRTNNALTAFDGLTRYFVSTIRGEMPSFLTPEDGYNTVNLIERLYMTENS